MKQKIELLAPAGNLESLLAAVHSGADAVYFGYGELNARRNAKNFDEQSLAEASRICKERGVKMHMTVNTMVYDREYEAVLRTLEIACKYGIDALIVQDLGVAALVRRAAPEMPLHASTQLTVHNVSGAWQARSGLFPGSAGPRDEPQRDRRHHPHCAHRDRSLCPWGAVHVRLGTVLYELSHRRAQRQPRALCPALPPALCQRAGRGTAAMRFRSKTSALPAG